MSETLRDTSKRAFIASVPNPTHQDIQTGAIQRIADATEAMAANHIKLTADRDWWKQDAEGRSREIDRLTRSNAALRGVITKLKRSPAKRPSRSSKGKAS